MKCHLFIKFIFYKIINDRIKKYYALNYIIEVLYHDNI